MRIQFVPMYWRYFKFEWLISLGSIEMKDKISLTNRAQNEKNSLFVKDLFAPIYNNVIHIMEAWKYEIEKRNLSETDKTIL